MRTTVKLDHAGRVVLPKALRDELHLAPGDRLDVSLERGGVSLRPQRAAPPLRKERGVWVFGTGERLTAEEVRKAQQSIREH